MGDFVKEEDHGAISGSKEIDNSVQELQTTYSPQTDDGNLTINALKEREEQGENCNQRSSQRLANWA